MPHSCVASSFRSTVLLKTRLGRNISAFSSSKSSFYCKFGLGSTCNCIAFFLVDRILLIYVPCSSNATFSSHSTISAILSSSTWERYFCYSKPHLPGSARFSIWCSWCHNPNGMIISYFPAFAIAQNTMVE